MTMDLSKNFGSPKNLMTHLKIHHNINLQIFFRPSIRGGLKFFDTLFENHYNINLQIFFRPSIQGGLKFFDTLFENHYNINLQIFVQ